MMKINLQNNTGFVMLFAVTLSAILLTIALGVSNIAFREVKFGTSARDTNDAFFAADTGAEYALFLDKAGNICASPCSRNFPVPQLGSLGQSCANVTIVKTSSPLKTTIVSKGYNTGSNGSNCNPPPSNSIERQIEVNY